MGRAYRDMTADAFRAALKRNGFEPGFMSTFFRDTTGVMPRSLEVPGVCILPAFKLERRKTLAHLIARRTRYAKTGK